MAIKDMFRFLSPAKTMAPDEERVLKARDQKAYQHIEKMLSLPVHKLNDYQSYLDACLGKIWASFRACDITANTVLQVDYHIAGPNGKEIENNDLNKLLDAPNQFDTLDELLYLTTFHLKLTGNAFWLKDEMDGAGRPTSLFPLLPQHMKVIPDDREKIKSYEYNVNGKQIFFKTDEIIHFKRPHPSDTLLGLGDVESSEPLFNKFLNNDSYSEAFFKNGAFPSGVLVREEYDGDAVDWERMKRKWESEYTGSNSQGKTAWLNGRWSYIQLGLNNKDLQTMEQSQMTTEEIFLAHGVPLSVAGIKEAGNYATSRQEYINFRRHTVLPLVQMIFSKLNHPTGFIKAFNEKWELSYSLSGLIDVEQASKDYELLVVHGAMSLNEYRRACGLDETDDENHDKYFLDTMRVPLEFAGAESISLTERFRPPTASEMDDVLDETEFEMPEEPEKEEEKPDAPEKGTGHHPSTVFAQNGKAKIIIIDPTKEVYHEYPKSATRNARKALAHKKTKTYTGGTLKMWATARRLADGKALSLDAITHMGSQARLNDSKGEGYEQNRFAIHLDAWGGTSGISWAKQLVDKVTEGGVDWETRSRRDAPNYMTSDDDEETCPDCKYSTGSRCDLYDFRHGNMTVCDDFDE
tara:strand:+ start:903 stop:2810 length:1908 start_codon:yes stop_codon:yes gene_type:complete